MNDDQGNRGPSNDGEVSSADERTSVLPDRRGAQKRRNKVTLRIPDDEIERPVSSRSEDGHRDGFSQPPIQGQPIIALGSVDEPTLVTDLSEARGDADTTLRIARAAIPQVEDSWTPYQPSVADRAADSAPATVREPPPSWVSSPQPAPTFNSAALPPARRTLVPSDMQPEPSIPIIEDSVSSSIETDVISAEDVVSADSIPPPVVAPMPPVRARQPSVPSISRHPSVPDDIPPSRRSPSNPAHGLATARTSQPTTPLAAPTPAVAFSVDPMAQPTPAAGFSPQALATSQPARIQAGQAAQAIAPSSLPVPRELVTTSPVAEPEQGTGKKKARAWWEDVFTEDYFRTKNEMHLEVLSEEVQFIEDSLGVERGGNILDLGCGSGEHAVELARRGYAVTGLDMSTAMLQRATELAKQHGANPTFGQADIREMTYDDAFDGVYSWDTSFGYFEEDKNAQLIARVHRALRKGGQFLLDVINRDFIVRQAPSTAWFEGKGCVCMDEMQIDWISSRMRIKRTVMFEDGRSRETESSIRVYSLHELGRMLHEQGFRVAEVSGGVATPGVFFGCESPRTLILAEKR